MGLGRPGTAARTKSAAPLEDAARLEDYDNRPLFFFVMLLHKALRKPIDQAMRRSGLTLSEGMALVQIAASSHVSSAELARRIEISPQSVNTLVKSLVNKKLIVRRGSPTSQRVLQITVTQKGEQTLDKLRKALRELEDELLGQLDPADVVPLRNSLVRLLKRFGPTVLRHHPRLFKT